MTTTQDIETRTYGGWRRVRGLELFGLSGPAAAAVIIGAALLLVLAQFSIRSALTASVPAGLVMALATARWDGLSVAQRTIRRVRWTLGRARRHTMLRTLTMTDWRLPGPLAATQLVTTEDDAGRPFAVVWNKTTGALTATLRCAAASTWLVDPRESDTWVSQWHSWLASLGYLPNVSHVAVTVDTAPEPGSTLADNVAARLDPHAPQDALDLMAELVRRSPGAAADVDTRVSITWDPNAEETGLPPVVTAWRWLRAAAGFPVRSVQATLAEQAAAFSRDLDGLESALGGCGVAVLGRATSTDLAGLVRMAYDPAARGEINRLMTAGDPDEILRWVEAGPIGADEEWSFYRHDSGVSVTWGWKEPPRQHVTADVLTRLVAPGRFPKRVTLLYRPRAAGEAAKLLERQVSAASFRSAWRRARKLDMTQRDVLDQAQAEQAAREEAHGAGVVLVSAYVTVTVPDPALLDAATADVEARASQSKVQLRRLCAGQAAGFAASLPAGVHPTLLAQGPQR